MITKSSRLRSILMIDNLSFKLAWGISIAHSEKKAMRLPTVTNTEALIRD